MSEIRVDKGVHLPPPAGGPGRPAKYPWRMLQIGDSFVWGPAEGHSSRVKASGLASKMAEKLGAKFTTRAIEENGRKVIRIWRVA
ncbi:MAG: hypothetical protein U1E23_09420 [Reyranellaceae bacterium]